MTDLLRRRNFGLTPFHGFLLKKIKIGLASLCEDGSPRISHEMVFRTTTDRNYTRSHLPQLEHQFLSQSSSNACEQAQSENRPILSFKTKNMLFSLSEKWIQNFHNKINHHEKNINIGIFTSMILATLRSPRARVSIPLMWAMNKSSTSVLSLRLQIVKDLWRFENQHQNDYFNTSIKQRWKKGY